VVVGVDGSASSLSAVRLAAGHAASHGLSLHIVHAFNWLPGRPEPNGVRPGDVIQHAVTTARRVTPGLVVTTRLLEGAATSTLLRQARAAALLAVGDGGLSAQVCLPTHSTAVHIAARAVCSVLVARTAPARDGPILVGVNGSSFSERVLDFAFDIAARNQAELVVLRAATSSPSDVGDNLADLVAPREDKYHLTASVRIVRGEPEAVLVAESVRAGLVIVGARGQQPYRGLLGSAAQTLLHHSPAPLILVRGLLPSRIQRSDRRMTGTAMTRTADLT
jgi:nucleotide-binding universal stress UspA family protein